MRELIFLLALLCFSECSTTMTSVMDYYGDANSAIAFYYRDACIQSADFTKTIMHNKTGSRDWKNFSCDDTIGFLPLRDDKVQIFVSASKKDESGNEYDTLKISVMYRAPGTVGTDPYDTIFTCDIQGGSVIDPTLTGRSDVENTVEKLDVSGATDPVTCSGIKMDMAKLAGFWKLEKYMKISGTQSPKVYFETAEVTAIDVQKLTDNVRCDPSKLTIASSKTTTDKVYNLGKLKKIMGTEGAVKLLDNKVQVPLQETAVMQLTTGVKCDAGFEFIYKVNGGEEKVARKVECMKHTLNGGDGKWKYMVDRPDAMQLDQAPLNGKYQKFAPVQRTMCVDGKYTVNNEEVTSIACADKCSALAAPHKDLPNSAKS